MRGAFVANRGARHHNIANVDCAVEHSRATANDELAASERDDALKARDSSGCTNPRMDHCQTPAAVVHRHYVDDVLLTENLYTYQPFRSFGSETNIIYTDVKDR